MEASFPGPIHMRGEPGYEATWRMKANSISCFVFVREKKMEFIILNSLYAFSQNEKRNALFLYCFLQAICQVMDSSPSLSHCQFLFPLYFSLYFSLYFFFLIDFDLG